MLSATIGFSKKHYALLGKILCQKEPETANRLISAYIPSEEPKETDFARIKEFFIIFCSIKDIEPSAYQGPLYKTSKVDVRRQFIAVILRLFCPVVYQQPTDSITLSFGLATELGKVFSLKNFHISKMAREVITWDKQYEGFAASVSSIIEKLNNGSAQGK